MNTPNQAQPLTDEEQHAIQLLAAIRSTFGTGEHGKPNNHAGALILAHLEQSTGTRYGAERPSCQFHGPGADGLTIDQRTYFNEGRKSIIFEIRAALAVPADADPRGPIAAR